MFVERVEFEPLGALSGEMAGRWSTRVIVHGSGFVIRAIPLVIAVGEQRAQLVMPLLDEAGEVVGLQGLLVERPQNGQEVSVGYMDGPLFPTGFEFSGGVA